MRKHYGIYPIIDENKLDEITKRRYVFKQEENGKVFNLLRTKQTLIIVRENVYKIILHRAKNRHIKIEAVKKQFSKIFILCSYEKNENGFSLVKLCERYKISQPKKKHLILFKEIGETNAKRTHYDKTAKTII